MLRPRALLPLLAALAVAPPAQAGTYEVRTCTVDGGFSPNRAWLDASRTPGDAAAYVRDLDCARPGEPLTLSLRGPAGAQRAYAPGAAARARFTAPPGLEVVDYALDLTFRWFSPPNEEGYVAASLAGGDEEFVAGGGDVPASRDGLAAEGRWYSDYRADDRLESFAPRRVVLRPAESPVQQRLLPRRSLSIEAGCWHKATSPCELGDADAAGRSADVFVRLHGARVTIRDDAAPVLAGPAAGQGLLAPGIRSGGEGVTLSASDQSGIRSVQLIDVTGAPVVVGAEDYAAGAETDAGAACDFSRPRPCPDLRDEVVTPTTVLAGRRKLVLRVTDAAGGTTDSAPFEVAARGGPNGANATTPAVLTAGWTATVRRRGGRVRVLRSTRTVSYGRNAQLRGTLRTPDGRPIAGAQVRVRTRLKRLGSTFVQQAPVVTDRNGAFVVPLPEGPSRIVRLSYAQFVADPAEAAKREVVLFTRARITASRASRRVRPRGSVRFGGRLVGGPLPPRGVTLELQAFQPRRGWRTIRTVRTRQGGRFTTRYRFNAPRGRFSFRFRLRPSDAYPYARGVSRTLRVRVG